jgi:hypothetical protein
MNLLVRLRRFIAEPLPALAPPAETAAPAVSQTGEAAPPAAETCVPVEALTGAARQRHFRLRRQRDPLGEGHPCTWRTLLIKVAAEVVVSRLRQAWPDVALHFRRVIIPAPGDCDLRPCAWKALRHPRPPRPQDRPKMIDGAVAGRDDWPHSA